MSEKGWTRLQEETRVHVHIGFHHNLRRRTPYILWDQTWEGIWETLAVRVLIPARETIRLADLEKPYA